MKVRFWGVRGSFAATGPDFLRYGGNTTAVEVIANSGHRVLVDLGTGSIVFARTLLAQEFGRGQGTLPVLLSHTHLDHIQGLPFFVPFFIKGNKFQIFGGSQNGLSLGDIVRLQLLPHYSPINSPDNFAATLEFHTLEPGTRRELPGFQMQSEAQQYRTGQVMAYRLEADDRSVVFMCHIEHPDSGPSETMLNLAHECDLLVHNATWRDDQYPPHRGWGKSSVSGAIAFAEQSHSRSLALFHHHPTTTDSQLDALVERARQQTKIPLIAAAEGTILDV